MIEIERKYLVNSTDVLKGLTGKRITQGYLSTDPERTVRVRLKDIQGFITIKGISTHDGFSRYEWEKEIPLNEAKELLQIALPGVIDKTRYEVVVDLHTWEIDIFHGANKGLVLAEIELQSQTEQFSTPKWIGAEVTGDHRYYNAYLSGQPFCEW